MSRKLYFSPVERCLCFVNGALVFAGVERSVSYVLVNVYSFLDTGALSLSVTIDLHHWC